MKHKTELLQVTHQVLYFKSLYDKQLSKVPVQQVLKTSYKSVCDSPKEFLEEIKNCATQLGGNLRIRNVPPPFSIRPKNFTESVLDALRTAFTEAENEITNTPDLNI